MKLANENTEIEVLETSLDQLGEEEVVIAPKKPKTKKKATAKPVVEETADEEEADAIDYSALITKWKAQHKRIFKNEIDGEIVIWRRLKRGEYKEILNTPAEDEESKIMVKQELMVKTAVLYPFNIDELVEENAGLATVLSEEILAKSGFAISYTEEI